MRDMRVVKLVESVLGVEPEEVLPYASVQGDLGAGAADLLAVLRRLRAQLPPGAYERLAAARDAWRDSPVTVAELVDLVEAVTHGGPVDEQAYAV